MSFSVIFSAFLFFAAEPAEAPQPKFSTTEAADCAAYYAFTLDAMLAAPNVPANVRMSMRDGLATWEYELAAANPGASSAMLQAAADAAVQKVRDNMPEGLGSDAAAARGEYLTAGAAKCAARITDVYGDEDHPVIAFLREADAEAGVLPAPQPVAAAGDELAVSERGLR